MLAEHLAIGGLPVGDKEERAFCGGLTPTL